MICGHHGPDGAANMRSAAEQPLHASLLCVPVSPGLDSRQAPEQAKGKGGSHGMHLSQDARRHLLRGVRRQHSHHPLRQDGPRVVGLVYEVYAGAAEARPRCHDRFVHPAALADASAGIIHIRWMSTSSYMGHAYQENGSRV